MDMMNLRVLIGFLVQKIVKVSNQPWAVERQRAARMQCSICSHCCLPWSPTSRPLPVLAGRDASCSRRWIAGGVCGAGSGGRL